MKYRNMFQYISCYSLSGEDSSKNYEASVFQYISCYSLSQWDWINQKYGKCFNTSHVTLYHE